jgi:hypothetical protein
MLKIADSTDHRDLLTKAEKGLISYRDTFFGGCLQREPCPYGGIDNVIDCDGGMGDVPCPSALFDERKRPTIDSLSRIIATRLADAPIGAPLKASLEAQQRSVENALSALKPH